MWVKNKRDRGTKLETSSGLMVNLTTQKKLSYTLKKETFELHIVVSC